MEYIVRYGECAYGPYTVEEAYATERQIKAYAKTTGNKAKIIIVPVQKWKV